MIKIKFFNAVGEDLDALTEWVNEVGYDAILDLNVVSDGRGNHGAIAIYKEKKDKQEPKAPDPFV